MRLREKNEVTRREHTTSWHQPALARTVIEGDDEFRSLHFIGYFQSFFASIYHRDQPRSIAQKWKTATNAATQTTEHLTVRRASEKAKLINQIKLARIDRRMTQRRTESAGTGSLNSTSAAFSVVSIQQQKQTLRFHNSAEKATKPVETPQMIQRLRTQAGDIQMSRAWRAEPLTPDPTRRVNLTQFIFGWLFRRVSLVYDTFLLSATGVHS